MDVQWNFPPGGSPFESDNSSMTAIDESGTAGYAPYTPPPSIPQAFDSGRRASVSAESGMMESRTSSWMPPMFEKTESQLARLTECLSSSSATSVLFSRLDPEQWNQILGALQEKKIPVAGIKIIEQGATGDHFYIVEDGNFEVYVHPSGSIQPGMDGLGNLVSKIGPGGSFGELALMYNAPRAASVVSTSPATVWALDRLTFRNILLRTAYQRRDMYDAFLQDVELLKSLKQYERGKIADVLETHTFKAGETIIQEGDVGNKFYLLVSGEAEVFKLDEATGKQTLVNQIEKGDYFGELALLNNEPRAASVVSRTDVKVASLDKAAFQRLLGPVEGIMRRNDPRYRRTDGRTGAGSVEQSPRVGRPGEEGVDPLAP